MSADSGDITLDGIKIPYARGRVFHISTTSAKVIAKNDKDQIMMTEHKYGKGRIFFVNFPLEHNMLQEVGAFDKERCKVYKTFFKKLIESKPVVKDSDFVALTFHEAEDKTYCVAVNHTAKAQKPNFRFNGVKADKVLYGNLQEIAPFDAVVFTVK